MTIESSVSMSVNFSSLLEYNQRLERNDFLADIIQDCDKRTRVSFNDCPYLAAQRSCYLFSQIEIVLRSVALHGENEYNLKAKKALIEKLESVV